MNVQNIGRARPVQGTFGIDKTGEATFSFESNQPAPKQSRKIYVISLNHEVNSADDVSELRMNVIFGLQEKLNIEGSVQMEVINVPQIDIFEPLMPQLISNVMFENIRKEYGKDWVFFIPNQNANISSTLAIFKSSRENNDLTSHNSAKRY